MNCSLCSGLCCFFACWARLSDFMGVQLVPAPDFLHWKIGHLNLKARSPSCSLFIIHYIMLLCQISVQCGMYLFALHSFALGWVYLCSVLHQCTILQYIECSGELGFPHSSVLHYVALLGCIGFSSEWCVGCNSCSGELGHKKLGPARQGSPPPSIPTRVADTSLSSRKHLTRILKSTNTWINHISGPMSANWLPILLISWTLVSSSSRSVLKSILIGCWSFPLA